MGSNTGIEWTRYTFNPWRGCTKISPACTNCYAEIDMSVKLHQIGWGDDAERVVKAESGWKQPLAWNRKAKREGKVEPVFCGSLMDICEDRDELIEPRMRVFELAEQCENLWWQFLTKRAANILNMIPRSWGAHRNGIPKNVSFGATMETQPYADERAVDLAGLNCLTFASIEPMLGPLDILPFTEKGLRCDYCGWAGSEATVDPTPEAEDVIHRCPECYEMLHHLAMDEWLDWVICGGESGKNARPTDDKWVRSLVKQCRSTETPVFVKQRTRKGRKIPFEEWPKDMQVREMPEVRR